MKQGTKRHKKREPHFCNSLIYSGVTGNRTRDTRIFSPLLYQLSYDTIFKNFPHFCFGIAKIVNISLSANFFLHFIRTFYGSSTKPAGVQEKYWRNLQLLLDSQKMHLPMFRKIVAIEDVLLNVEAEMELQQYAETVEMHYDKPESDDEIIRRIGDADCVLVSFKTGISRHVIESCPHIRYIGMCCTLYDKNSCNVDIQAAEEHGIKVRGVRDYGDEGVVEYAVSEIVRFLHGFGDRQWREKKHELGGMNVGIIGLGTTGRMCADAFRFFGSNVFYFSRTRKSDAEQAGISYLDLHPLLERCDIVLTTLPRNTYLLQKEEFDIFGNGKILMNTSIGATFDTDALKEWLTKNRDSAYFCDGTGMGTLKDELAAFNNVFYTPSTAGMSVQSTARLSRKAIDNIRTFLSEKRQSEERP